MIQKNLVTEWSSRLEGRAFRLKRTGFGSDRYGDCEICGKRMDSAYTLTRLQRKSLSTGKESIEYKDITFGHKDCLSSKTYQF